LQYDIIIVIKFICSGRNKSEAARVFGISSPTIDRWLKGNLRMALLLIRNQNMLWKKLEPKALKAYVEAHSDLTLVEYASHFGLSAEGVMLSLRRLKIT
jgi:transposase